MGSECLDHPPFVSARTRGIHEKKVFQDEFRTVVESSIMYSGCRNEITWVDHLVVLDLFLAYGHCFPLHAHSSFIQTKKALKSCA